jgi:hypothetical protein
MGMPPGQRPELRLSTSDPSTERTNYSHSSAFTTRPTARSDTPVSMTTELRLPGPAMFSPHMPSPGVQLPPIFPYPPTGMTQAQAAPPQRHMISPRHGSPYTQSLPPSSRPGPPLHTELPPTQSPTRSRSSYSPSLVPSASSPRNFELPLDRKRSFDQALSDNGRYVWLTMFLHRYTNISP